MISKKQATGFCAKMKLAGGPFVLVWRPAGAGAAGMAVGWRAARCPLCGAELIGLAGMRPGRRDVGKADLFHFIQIGDMPDQFDEAPRVA